MSRKLEDMLNETDIYPSILSLSLYAIFSDCKAYLDCFARLF